MKIFRADFVVLLKIQQLSLNMLNFGKVFSLKIVIYISEQKLPQKLGRICKLSCIKKPIYKEDTFRLNMFIVKNF